MLHTLAFVEVTVLAIVGPDGIYTENVQEHGHLGPRFMQTVVEITVTIITDVADGIFKTEPMSKDKGS